MRLRDETPDLPRGEGKLYAPNNGGKHAQRFSGLEREYNPLRDAELLPLAEPRKDIAGINSSEIGDLLFGNKHELIIAHQIDHPTQSDRLAGVAIGQHTEVGEFETRMIVKELVVHPDLRRRHLASYMLGRLTQNFDLTEMIVATDRFVPEPWFVEGLESAGFHHAGPNGSPAIWLPGIKWRGQGNRNSKDFIQKFESSSHMPKGWNGYGEFHPKNDEEHPQTRIYRDGTLTGIIRPVEKTDRFDNELNDSVQDFTVADAGGAQLDTLKAVTQKEAMIAVLNAYGLIEKAA